MGKTKQMKKPTVHEQLETLFRIGRIQYKMNDLILQLLDITTADIQKAIKAHERKFHKAKNDEKSRHTRFRDFSG